MARRRRPARRRVSQRVRLSKPYEKRIRRKGEEHLCFAPVSFALLPSWSTCDQSSHPQEYGRCSRGYTTRFFLAIPGIFRKSKSYDRSLFLAGRLRHHFQSCNTFRPAPAAANGAIRLRLDASYFRLGLLKCIPSSSCVTWKPRSCTRRRFHCRFNTAVVNRLMLRGFCIILAAIS